MSKKHYIKITIKKLQDYLKVNKTTKIIIAVIMVLGLLFYWYEYRPSQIKKECFKEAGEKAEELLKTKAELSGKYKEEAERGLFFKDDFEQYYKNCLRKKGF